MNYKETDNEIILKINSNNIEKEEYNKIIEEIYENYKPIFLYNIRNLYFLEENDLISDYYLILLKSIQQFDISKNTKFSVYLTSKIKFYVKNILNNTTNYTVVDEKVEELKHQIDNIKNKELKEEKIKQLKQLQYSKKYNDDYIYKQIDEFDKENLSKNIKNEIDNKIDVDIFLTFAKNINIKTYEIFIDYYYNNLTLLEISEKHNNCSKEAIRVRMEDMINLYKKRISLYNSILEYKKKNFN